MGIEQKDFVKTFKLALSDDSVVEKLVESTTNHIDFEINKLKDLHTQLRNDIVQYSELSKALQKEVSELREIIKKKDNRIEKLEQAVDVLTYKLDDYE